MNDVIVNNPDSFPSLSKPNASNAPVPGLESGKSLAIRKELSDGVFGTSTVCMTLSMIPMSWLGNSLTSYLGIIVFVCWMIVVFVVMGLGWKVSGNLKTRYEGLENQSVQNYTNELKSALGNNASPTAEKAFEALHIIDPDVLSQWLWQRGVSANRDLMEWARTGVESPSSRAFLDFLVRQLPIRNFKQVSHPHFMAIQRLVMMANNLRDDTMEIGHLLPEILSVSALLRLSDVVEAGDEELGLAVQKIESSMNALSISREANLHNQPIPISSDTHQRHSLRVALKDA